jgi:hypothetical protein
MNPARRSCAHAEAAELDRERLRQPWSPALAAE